MMKKLKLAVVDESLLTIKLISDRLKDHPSIELAGKFYEIRSVIDKIAKLRPHVVVVDFELKKNNGAEFVKRLFNEIKVPIIAISANKSDEDEAIKAGAVNFLLKPEDMTAAADEFAKQLFMEINIASIKKFEEKTRIDLADIKANRSTKKSIIAIGASTGGTEAIYSIISKLKRSGLPPILIVQHMPAGFTKSYAERLDRECELSAEEATDRRKIQPDTVYVAAGEHHLTLHKSADGSLMIRSQRGDKVSSHCPSVDVMFESVAKTMSPGDNILGVILTGMGKDGAKGLLKLRQMGAYTIGQDKESSIVYGMPMEAYNIGAVTKQLPLDKIADEITTWAEGIKKE